MLLQLYRARAVGRDLWQQINQVQGHRPRTRFIYGAINPRNPWHNLHSDWPTKCIHSIMCHANFIATKFSKQTWAQADRSYHISHHISWQVPMTSAWECVSGPTIQVCSIQPLQPQISPRWEKNANYIFIQVHVKQIDNARDHKHVAYNCNSICIPIVCL